MIQRIGPASYGFLQSWLGRLLGGLLAAALLVAAFFFVFIFLIVLGVVVLAVSLRLLWTAKKARAQASQDILEGEYTVEPHDEEITDRSAADTAHKVIRDVNNKLD